MPSYFAFLIENKGIDGPSGHKYKFGALGQHDNDGTGRYGLAWKVSEGLDNIRSVIMK